MGNARSEVWVEFLRSFRRIYLSRSAGQTRGRLPAAEQEKERRSSSCRVASDRPRERPRLSKCQIVVMREVCRPPPSLWPAFLPSITLARPLFRMALLACEQAALRPKKQLISSFRHNWSDKHDFLANRSAIPKGASLNIWTDKHDLKDFP